LQGLKLSVFDPPGETLAVLKDNDVPHETLRESPCWKSRKLGRFKRN
jgi:hypothetical protein